MKNLTIFFFALCSYTTQAQITGYNHAFKSAFYGIGGYSYSQQSFPNGVQTNPYIISGPSPQNDFSFSIFATGGIKNVSNVIATNTTNTNMMIQFKGNNVRKFGCNVIGLNAAGTNGTNDIVNVTATTNLGANITLSGYDAAPFVGFNVTGENEYLVSVSFQFQATPNPTALIGFYRIMVGNNSTQNVALNFDGLDDFVSIPSTVGNFGTNDNFTVSCWVKPDASTIGEQNIINKWSGSGGYAFTIRYYGSNGTILAGQYDGTNFSYVQSTTNLKDSKWHHVAFVKNGSSLLLYIDGIQEGGTSIDNANLSTTNTTPLEIGREATGTKYFKGEIDEVRIWTVAKTVTEIADERFCKTPNSTNLHAFYNFNNGVPHGDNILISQVNEAINSANDAILLGFSKLGDVSNFVTGQVKYVKRNATGSNNGSSWANAFTSLQSALVANTCNDLFDVYVATSIYRPAVFAVNVSFNIPSGMRIYGGFAGTEKSINQRNLALIHSTNETTLSGDVAADDIISDFSQNRSDNSKTVVNIQNKSNILIDGFSIRGGFGASYGGGITALLSDNITINQCKLFDNVATNGGAIDAVRATNLKISNTYFLGNKAISALESGGGDVLYSNISNNQVSSWFMINCIVSGHTGNYAIAALSQSGSILTQQYTNCTFANNNRAFFNLVFSPAITNFTLKNSIIYGNTNNNGVFGDGTLNKAITNSLVQGEANTANGNLVGTSNPQFVLLPTPTGIPSLAGDYRLKDSSPCINVGDDVGVSPLDLDRNPRPKGGKTDMGAYESNVNMNEIISIATGNWESNTTWNLGRVPSPTDKVIVNGHQVTVTTNTARAKDLEYKTGAFLRYLSGGVLRFGL